MKYVGCSKSILCICVKNSGTVFATDIDVKDHTIEETVRKQSECEIRFTSL